MTSLNILKETIREFLTYREGVEPFRHSLAAEFDAEGVFTCVLHVVIDAESPVSIIHDIYV